MLSSIFGCGGMRQGGHHLYDEIVPEDEAIENGGLKDSDFDWNCFFLIYTFKFLI